MPRSSCTVIFIGRLQGKFQIDRIFQRGRGEGRRVGWGDGWGGSYQGSALVSCQSGSGSVSAAGLTLRVWTSIRCLRCQPRQRAWIRVTATCFKLKGSTARTTIRNGQPLLQQKKSFTQFLEQLQSWPKAYVEQQQISAYITHKNLYAKSRKRCGQRTQTGTQSQHVSNKT